MTSAVQAPPPAEERADMTSARALERLLSRIHDPEVGLIQFIADVPMQPDEAAIHVAVAEYQNPFRLPPLSRAVRGELPEPVRTGTGAGLDRLSARWSTVGEAVERYALHVYDEADILRARFGDEVAGFAEQVSPDRFILFDDAQFDRPGFRFKRFDRTLPLAWIGATRLNDGAPVLLPAALACFGYQPQTAAERLDAGYSTGGAAGPSLKAAWHSGLLEVIERDGFACHWYLRRSPPELSLDAFAAGLRPELLDVLGSAPLKLRLFDLTTDLGVPTVLALGLPRQGGVAIGAAARPTFEQAIEKAAIEAFHTHNWVLELRRHGARIDDPSEIHAYRDHVVWHLDARRHGTLDFLLAGGGARLPTRPYGGDDQERLAALVERLEGCGLRAYGMDLTPPEVDGMGLFVGRAFAPGLHPLGSGVGNEHLDPRRLARFADAVGMAMPRELNRAPHPFP